MVIGTVLVLSIAAGSEDDNETKNVSVPSTRLSEMMVMLTQTSLTPLENVRTVLTGR